MIEKVKKTIIKHGLLEEAGTAIVVGLSGGPDSLSLLKVLCELKEDFGIEEIFAVHINHMYRGEPAFADEYFCRDFCEEHQIGFRAYRFDVEKIAEETGESTEEAGRRLRYGAFREVAEELRHCGTKVEGTDRTVKIAVAHNKEDNAETLIMRLARGTGTEGLCGIEYKREDIIRPLLDISRSEIEAFCELRGLTPRIDGTNLEPIYTRNKVRLEVIPYINKALGCDIVETLGRLSASASEDREFFSAEVSRAAEKAKAEEGKYIIEELKALMPAIRKRLVVKAFADAGLKQDIGASHLEAAERLVFSEKTTGDVSFPRGFMLKKRYGQLIFFAPEEDKKQGCRLKLTVVTDREEVTSFISLKKDRRDKDFQIFDRDSVREAGEPVLRTRKQGDIISPLGFDGTKKLKNYFIDRKVDRDIRDRLPLVAAGNIVLWIPGMEVNQRFAAKHDSTSLIIMEVECAEK